MRRFILAAVLVASELVCLAPSASANTDDRGPLALPVTVQLAQSRAEAASLALQLADVTAQRDDAQAQLQQVAAERDQLKEQLAGLTAGRGGPVVQAGASVGPVSNHFTPGQCTWWVASKRPIPWFGNAGQWGPNAAAMGFPEGMSPRVGAVMVTWESAIGHVAYVEAVYGDGSWLVSEMNYVAPFVVDFRTIRPGGVPLETFVY